MSKTDQNKGFVAGTVVGGILGAAASVLIQRNTDEIQTTYERVKEKAQDNLSANKGE
jgi:gas vesicle protein